MYHSSSAPDDTTTTTTTTNETVIWDRKTNGGFPGMSMSHPPAHHVPRAGQLSLQLAG